MKSLALLLATLALAACSSTPMLAPGGCTGLDPERCLLPWPSSAFLVADETTRTGWRVSIPPGSMPINDRKTRIDPAGWNSWDGFSSMTTLLAEFDAVIDPAPLTSWHDPGASMMDASPTVLVDVDTGEKIAHFAEIEDSPEVAPGHTELYIRPAARLGENKHYAVGIRSLKTMDGSPLAAPAAFAALRDGGSSKIDASWYETNVFAPLANAGVARKTLILAWDFRTASGPTAWGDVVAMRDDAFAMAGSSGLGCTIASSMDMDASDTQILRRVDGTITVPSFLDANGRIARDATGRPMIVGTAEAPFTALIPRSTGVTAPVWVYGHGLFSDHTELLRDFARDDAFQGGAVIVGTDFNGLTGSDEANAASAFLDPSTFASILDPLRQSYVNVLLLPRTISGSCGSHPEFQVGGATILDGKNSGYFGNSLGGTLGTSLAALTPDIPHFDLGVAGTDLPVQMPRNYAWPNIDGVFQVYWPERIDRDLIVVMSAEYWDLVDSALLPHALADPLPGSIATNVLIQIGLYDTDVVNVSSELAARTLGVAQLSATPDPIWGLAQNAAPQPNAIVVYDTGAAPITDGTIPPTENGVHEKVRLDPRSQHQLVTFLQGGGVIDTCGGACTPMP
jgi:hypothetical protein